MEDSCVTVKAALQSSLKHKTRDREKDCQRTWEVGRFFSLCCIYIFSCEREKKTNLFTKKKAQPNGASSVWWGKKVINGSVLKSKKKKAGSGSKISDIYMCDKIGREGKKCFGQCRRVKAAVLEVSQRAQLGHRFIAAWRLAAPSATRLQRRSGRAVELFAAEEADWLTGWLKSIMGWAGRKLQCGGEKKF